MKQQQFSKAFRIEKKLFKRSGRVAESFTSIASKTSNFCLIATFPDLLNIFFWILKAFENCNDFPIKVYCQYINDRDHQDKNNHKNQTKNDKDLKNSLK